MELLKYFQWEVFLVTLILTALSIYAVQTLGFCKKGRSKDGIVLFFAFAYTVLSFFVFYNLEGAIADSIIQFIFTWLFVFLIYTEKGRAIIGKLKSMGSGKIGLK